MRLINLTPHKITLVTKEGVKRDYYPEGLARIVSKSSDAGFLSDDEGNTYPVEFKSFGLVEGIPQPRNGVGYIVSAMVANNPAVRDRDDLYVPNDVQRDPSNRDNVLGCRSLWRPWK